MNLRNETFDFDALHVSIRLHIVDISNERTNHQENIVAIPIQRNKKFSAVFLHVQHLRIDIINRSNRHILCSFEHTIKTLFSIFFVNITYWFNSLIRQPCSSFRSRATAVSTTKLV
jgi:hypothetical protein